MLRKTTLVQPVLEKLEASLLHSLNSSCMMWLRKNVAVWI